MKASGSGKAVAGRLLSRNRWTGARSIGLAHQLNEQVIECCCELSLDVESCNQIPLVASHRDLWRSLESVARKRLAQFPFVIVDLRFGDVAWWGMAAGNGAHPRNHSNRIAPAARWDELALETLMFGWQVAREDRIVASMLFAMPPPVVDCIAALTMGQVRALAVESTKHLRLRWDQHPRMWRELLNASREQDEAELEITRRMAKLYFCGELIHALPAGSGPIPLVVSGNGRRAAQEH